MGSADSQLHRVSDGLSDKLLFGRGRRKGLSFDQLKLSSYFC